MRIGTKFWGPENMLWTVLSHDHITVVAFVKRLDGISDIRTFERKRIVWEDDDSFVYWGDEDDGTEDRAIDSDHPAV